jgi:hypothetical protein
MMQDYSGHEIVGRGLIIRNTGDGLSKAMQADPVDLPIGATVAYGVTGTVVEHKLVEVPDSGGKLRLVAVVKADGAVKIDRADLTTLLVEQRKRLDELNGTPQIEFDGEFADPSAQPDATVASISDRPKRSRAKAAD